MSEINLDDLLADSYVMEESLRFISGAIETTCLYHPGEADTRYLWGLHHLLEGVRERAATAITSLDRYITERAIAHGPSRRRS